MRQEQTNLRTPEEKRGGDLLLIIDMQNVYLSGQPWACSGIEAVQSQILRLLESPKTTNVLFTRYIPSDHPVGRWAEYNRLYEEINANPWMSEMVESLFPYTNRWPVYDKAVYSSYSIREVQTLAARAERVVIAGVVAECCVLATVFGAVDAGDPVVYLTDAVAGLTEDSRQTAQQIVESFAPLHVSVMTTEEYLHALQGSR